MDAVLQVAQLQNGNFAIRSIGGTTLNTTLAEFATQAEAEEWMLRRSFSQSGSTHIMRPGDGEAVG